MAEFAGTQPRFFTWINSLRAPTFDCNRCNTSICNLNPISLRSLRCLSFFHCILHFHNLLSPNTIFCFAAAERSRRRRIEPYLNTIMVRSLHCFILLAIGRGRLLCVHVKRIGWHGIEPKQKQKKRKKKKLKDNGQVGLNFYTERCRFICFSVVEFISFLFSRCPRALAAAMPLNRLNAETATILFSIPSRPGHITALVPLGATKRELHSHINS